MTVELADQLRDELLEAKALGDDNRVAQLERQIYILENQSA